MNDPRRLLARIALAGVILVLLVTTSSAYLRLTAAGLGCDDWPACYGRTTAAPSGSDAAGATQAPAAAAQDATAPAGTNPARMDPTASGPAQASEAPARTSGARLLHRISASAAGAAVLAIALIAFVNRRELGHELRVAAVLLVVTLALALLGRATPGAQSPAVPVGNLLGGMTMAGLLGWLALGGARRPAVERAAGNAAAQPARGAAPGEVAWLSALALALLAAELTLGAMTSATYSSLACSTLPDCGGRWWPADWSAHEFDMRLPYSQRIGASAALHLAHRYTALAVLAACLSVTALLWRRRRGLALALGGLLAVQVLLGLGTVWLGLPLAVTLLHNVTAALLMLALVAAHRVLLAR